MSTTFDLVKQNVKATQLAVGLVGTNAALGAAGPTPHQQSGAKAVQSIGQTTAIVVQDAADTLRNLNTIETTAIGTATAAWLATQNPAYLEIIQTSMEMMTQAAALYLTIGTNAAAVLKGFE